jgi:DnaJ-class molecular chaperone
MITTNQPIYQICIDCKGEGVREKTIDNDGIEIDAPCHCWTCNGSGKVLKDEEEDDD